MYLLSLFFLHIYDNIYEYVYSNYLVVNVHGSCLKQFIA